MTELIPLTYEEWSLVRLLASDAWESPEERHGFYYGLDVLMHKADHNAGVVLGCEESHDRDC